MKLEKLSSKQEAKMLEIKDFWLDYIFSCKNTEINKEAAKIGIDWLYKLSGYNNPIVIYVDSPLGCQYAVTYLKEFTSQIFRDNVWANVGDNVWANVGANVRANVWDNVWDNVRDNVWDNVRANVWANVWDNVRDNVRANVRDNVRANVRDNVWDNVGDNVWANVGANVWDNVGDNVWDNVGDNVRDNVWDNVRANVWANVGANVWANVRDNVGANVGDNVGANVGAKNFENFASYGSIGDYGWVSFYDFFTQIGVLNHDGFNSFKEVLLSGIYDMIQLNGFCIVSSLPNSIKRDSNNKLHCIDGPAITFKDSYNQYYWHGVAISPQWILFPETITKEIIYAETNAEKRRCLMEILGEGRYAQLLDLEHVEIDYYNSQQVVLLKTKNKDNVIDDFIYFIKVICQSTGRNYYLCVPHEAFKMGAIGALSWTFGLQSNEYNLLIET